MCTLATWTPCRYCWSTVPTSTAQHTVRSRGVLFEKVEIVVAYSLFVHCKIPVLNFRRIHGCACGVSRWQQRGFADADRIRSCVVSARHSRTSSNTLGLHNKRQTVFEGESCCVFHPAKLQCIVLVRPRLIVGCSFRAEHLVVVRKRPGQADFGKSDTTTFSMSVDPPPPELGTTLEKLMSSDMKCYFQCHVK